MNAARLLAYHFLDLPFHEQVKISYEFGFGTLYHDLSDLQSQDLCRAVIEQAKKDDELAKLWREVEIRHKDGQVTPNPYKQTKFRSIDTLVETTMSEGVQKGYFELQVEEQKKAAEEVAQLKQRIVELETALRPFALVNPTVFGPLRPEEHWLWKPDSSHKDIPGINRAHILEAKKVLRGTCLKCGGKMVSRGARGYDRHNQEIEADWEECEKCGFTEE